MTRVAAIDCGTNSIRLLVADLDAERSTLTEVDRRMEIVRLGQDVDRTGRLAPEALTRTFAACDRYADVVRRTGATPVRFVATSATRDVANRDEFAAGVHDRLGVEPEVVSGDTEAELSFTGATRELAGSDLDHPFLVVDIGGGSTELVLGDPGAAPRAARSVDVGSVRMTERHLAADPPTLRRWLRPAPTSRPRCGWRGRPCRCRRPAPSSGWPAPSRRSRRWRSTSRRTSRTGSTTPTSRPTTYAGWRSGCSR